MTATEYLAAAMARAADSDRLWAAGRHCGAIYMAGYAVECRLKALLVKLGKPVPTSGRAGHDLRRLWEAAGFRRLDSGGHRRLFLDSWSTDLRYRSALASELDPNDLRTGARELSAYVQYRLRNTR